MFKRSLALMAAITVTISLTSVSTYAGDKIVVGRSLALSGPLAGYGEAKRDGGDAYINKINATGGVAGKRLELVTLDDAYTPAITVANLKKIAAEQAPTAFLGLFGVPTVAAALPVLTELKIPAVGLTTGADAVRTPVHRYAFPVRASYASEARKMISLVKIANITKISVIYADNPFGESVKNTLLKALRDEGLSADTFKVDPAAKGAAQAAQQATASGPKALFLALLSQAAVPVITELKKSAYNGALYTFSPVDTSVVTKQLGDKAHGLAISQVVPMPNSVHSIKIVNEYAQALKELGRGTPSYYGLEAFIEAKVLVEGLKRAGSQPTAASLIKGLETMHDFDLGGYYVSYKADAHIGSQFVEVNLINADGRVMR
jgi:branched-chain amino acid transport system substrate-binding protein